MPLYIFLDVGCLECDETTEVLAVVSSEKSARQVWEDLEFRGEFGPRHEGRNQMHVTEIAVLYDINP